MSRERDDQLNGTAYAVCNLVAGTLLLTAIGYVASQIEGPTK